MQKSNYYRNHQDPDFQRTVNEESRQMYGGYSQNYTTVALPQPFYGHALYSQGVHDVSRRPLQPVQITHDPVPLQLPVATKQHFQPGHHPCVPPRQSQPSYKHEHPAGTPYRRNPYEDMNYSVDPYQGYQPPNESLQTYDNLREAFYHEDSGDLLGSATSGGLSGRQYPRGPSTVVRSQHQIGEKVLYHEPPQSYSTFKLDHANTPQSWSAAPVASRPADPVPGLATPARFLGPDARQPTSTNARLVFAPRGVLQTQRPANPNVVMPTRQQQTDPLPTGQRPPTTSRMPETPSSSGPPTPKRASISAGLPSTYQPVVDRKEGSAKHSGGKVPMPIETGLRVLTGTVDQILEWGRKVEEAVRADILFEIFGSLDGVRRGPIPHSRLVALRAQEGSATLQGVFWEIDRPLLAPAPGSVVSCMCRLGPKASASRSQIHARPQLPRLQVLNLRVVPPGQEKYLKRISYVSSCAVQQGALQAPPPSSPAQPAAKTMKQTLISTYVKSEQQR